MNYLNENDEFMADWLDELNAAGEIPECHVDRRSIVDVTGRDLEGYKQCHFFAGCAGWPLALRLAGWHPDRPIWTGSCPCQPFSQAGGGGNESDERHLWPEFYRLIDWRVRQNGPIPDFVGEQVESKDGRSWLAGVRADLDLLGLAVGAADLCAAGVASPQIRQRLWWVAHGEGGRLAELWGEAQPGNSRHADSRGPDYRVADATDANRGAGDSGEQGHARRWRYRSSIDSTLNRLDYAIAEGLEGRAGYVQAGSEPRRINEGAPRPAAEAGAWDRFTTVGCGDGKTRRLGSSIAPLAYGLPPALVPSLAGVSRVDLVSAKANRVGRLRGYGNAIVVDLAAEFLCAMEEAIALLQEEHQP